VIGDETETVQWKDLRVGTIIKLNKNNVVPADCILLARETPEDEVYIRTD
jgi:magnesium-transporting ATPase (P-type)